MNLVLVELMANLTLLEERVSLQGGIEKEIMRLLLIKDK